MILLQLTCVYTPWMRPANRCTWCQPHAHAQESLQLAATNQRIDAELWWCSAPPCTQRKGVKNPVTFTHPTRLSLVFGAAHTMLPATRQDALLLLLLSLIAALLNVTGQVAKPYGMHVTCNCKPATLASPEGVAQVLERERLEIIRPRGVQLHRTNPTGCTR